MQGWARGSSIQDSFSRGLGPARLDLGLREANTLAVGRGHSVGRTLTQGLGLAQSPSLHLHPGAFCFTYLGGVRVTNGHQLAAVQCLHTLFDLQKGRRDINRPGLQEPRTPRLP